MSTKRRGPKTSTKGCHEDATEPHTGRDSVPHEKDTKRKEGRRGGRPIEARSHAGIAAVPIMFTTPASPRKNKQFINRSYILSKSVLNAG